MYQPRGKVKKLIVSSFRGTFAIKSTYRGMLCRLVTRHSIFDATAEIGCKVHEVMI